MSDAHDLALLQEAHTKAVAKAVKLRGQLVEAERVIDDLAEQIASYEGRNMTVSAGVASAVAIAPAIGGSS